MINSRIRGLLRIQGIALLVLLPLWFLLHVAIARHAPSFLLGPLGLQSNLAIYLVGIVASCLFAFHYNERRLPRGKSRQQWVAAVRQANADVIILALVIFGLVFLTKDAAVSRRFLAVFLADTWLLWILLNRYLPDVLARLMFSGRNLTTTVLIGSPRAASRLSEWIADGPKLGLNIIGLICPESATTDDPTLPIIGQTRDLRHLLSEHGVQQAVLLETGQDKEWVRQVMEVNQREGCRLLVYNHWEEYFHQNLRPVLEGEHLFFTLRQEPLENPINRLTKRLVDIVLSLPVVVFILPPLTFLVWLAQRFQSPGPIFHAQERAGLAQRGFAMLKFRSMHVRPASAGDEAQQAAAQDPRVFAFGRFLRRRSLDELPQFVNVLFGQMSIVGPRPHLPDHDDQFSEVIAIYRSRYLVKPGITGLSQVRGYRGEIRSLACIQERVRLDLEYISEWSIWLDIGIILKTAYQIFFPPRSAY